MTEWKDKKVAVLGYGVEGKSSVDYFLRHGGMVTVHEGKPEERFDQAILKQERDRGVEFIFGEKAFGNLSDFDVVMRTPTFPPSHPALEQVEPARIQSQTSLFLTKWRDQTIGITGTKGKGTTASLLYHILSHAQRKVLLGGNIGVPLLDIIDDMTPDHVAVVELSSFQLWDTTVSPHIAVLLMVTPEHLEQHKTLDNYLAAKQNILRYQTKEDLAIILSDYPMTKHLANMMPAPQKRIGAGWNEDGAIIDGLQMHIVGNELDYEISLNQTQLKGEHNTANVAAAIVVSHVMGVSKEVVLAALPTYQPLPHRLQLVTTHQGISFYDDSIATTPEATIAAIKSFHEPMVVVLGGINKGADWNGVAKALAAHRVKGVVLMGDEADRIQDALDGAHIDLPRLTKPDSYDQVVSWAVNLFHKDNTQHGIVLLSPGAKSFDQFMDYQDRGYKFQQAVQKFTESQI